MHWTITNMTNASLLFGDLLNEILQPLCMDDEVNASFYKMRVYNQPAAKRPADWPELEYFFLLTFTEELGLSVEVFRPIFMRSHSGVELCNTEKSLE